MKARTYNECENKRNPSGKIGIEKHGTVDAADVSWLRDACIRRVVRKMRGTDTGYKLAVKAQEAWKDSTGI